jgi:hypothetical protein
MSTITERHLIEVRAALAKHDQQRIILANEVSALEKILADINGGETPSDQYEEYENSGPRYGSKRWRMESEIEEFLRASGKPMHRIQIRDHLTENGIIGHEANPLANVSNVLSTSTRFRPAGNGLWELVEPTE